MNPSTLVYSVYPAMNPGNPQNQGPQVKIVFENCPVLNQIIFKVVHQPSGCYYHYYYSPKENQMFLHHCKNCQPVITENVLDPLYPYYDKDLQETVLVVSNRFARKLECYTYSFKTGSLTQVEPPNFVDEPDKNVEGTLVATIKSKTSDETVVIWRGTSGNLVKTRSGQEGRMEQLSQAPLRRLATQDLDSKTKEEIENRDVSSYYTMQVDKGNNVMKNILNDYTKRIQPAIYCLCQRTQQYYISVFNVFKHDHSKFYFDEDLGSFQPFFCEYCCKGIHEGCLFPKYAELLHGNFIFYMHNSMTGIVEQYGYSEKTTDFEQAWLPCYSYNPAKDAQGAMIAIVKSKEGMTAILRGPNGSVRKERTSSDGNHFTILPPVAVSTLLDHGKKMYNLNESSGNLKSSKPQCSTSEDVNNSESSAPESDEMKNSETPESTSEEAKNSEVVLTEKEIERRRLKNRKAKEKKKVKREDEKKEEAAHRELRDKLSPRSKPPISIPIRSNIAMIATRVPRRPQENKPTPSSN